MNAVNLLPPDLRRGAGSPGRSGVAVYAVLGALALAVVLASVAALMKGQVADRKSEVARVEAEATIAEQRAATLTRYKELAAETSRRVTSIKTLAAGRVNWASSLREVSEAVGSEVYFNEVSATSTAAAAATPAPAPAATGAAGAPEAGSNPSLKITGCARDHKAVARLLTRFRSMDRVTAAKLAESDVGDESTAAAAGATGATGADSASGDCRAGGRLKAQFTATIEFEPVVKAPATTTAAATGATPPTTPASGGTK